MDLVLRKPGDPAYDAAHVIRHLRAGVDDQSAVFHLREADMRLKRGMLYLARLIRCLDHSIGFCKGLVHITYAAVVSCSDVVEHISVKWKLIEYMAFSLVSRKLGVVFIQIVRSSGVVFYIAVMHQRRSLSHGLLYGEHSRERFVFDLDQIARLYRFLERLRHYSSNPVTHVSNFLIQKLSVMR